MAAKKKTKAAKKSASKKVSKAVKSVKAKAAVKKTTKKVVKKATATKKAKKAVVKKTVPVKAKTVKKAKAIKTTKVKSAPKATSEKSVKSSKVNQAQFDFQNFVTPLDDRMLVRLSGSEKMTAGGLYIPDTVSDVSGNLQGTVVCVGRGHRSAKGHIRPMDVVVGDMIVFAEHSGSKIKIHNEDLIILRESDVMGVVSK